MAGPRNPSEADTVVGGREASTCRCDALWPRQANWVKITPSAPAISNCSQELSTRINPGHRTPNAVSKPANLMESAAQGERSWTVRVEDSGDINRSGRGFPRSSIAVRPKASRILWTYGRSAGAIQIWNGSRSRALTSSATPPRTDAKTLAAVDTDSSIRRSRRPRFVAAARIPAGQVVG
jgi:hypothetical protein